ncbi:MAG: thiamine phosphate synthase [Vicinamibacterales bacterium]
MITDRQRHGTGWESTLVNRVRAAALAGVHLVQVRERDLDAASLTRLVTACVESVRGTETRIVVNDRLDVALAAGAHGVHLRGDSMPAERVRRVAGRPFLIGRSVHDRDEAIRVTEGSELDYLVFGTVFDSRSKSGSAPAGLDRLSAVTAATRVPVLAVGGMTVERFASVVEAGAAGGAAIGLFADASADSLVERILALVKSARYS